MTDLIAHVRALKGFTIGPVTTVTIGGATGMQLDVSSNKTTDNWIFLTKTSGIGMRPSSKFRMMFFDREGKVILLGLETDSATNFNAFASAAQSILDSILWT